MFPNLERVDPPQIMITVPASLSCSTVEYDSSMVTKVSFLVSAEMSPD